MAQGSTVIGSKQVALPERHGGLRRGQFVDEAAQGNTDVRATTAVLFTGLGAMYCYEGLVLCSVAQFKALGRLELPLVVYVPRVYLVIGARPAKVRFRGCEGHSTAFPEGCRAAQSVRYLLQNLCASAAIRVHIRVV